jgi:hypothetical protein
MSKCRKSAVILGLHYTGIGGRYRSTLPVDCLICHNTQMISPKRFLRFSLRTLLILITVLAVWLGSKMSAARRQKEAVETMLNSGATLQYDYQMKRRVPTTGPFVPNGHVGVKLPEFTFDSNAPLPGPAWLRTKLGDDYFCTVVAVNYPEPKFAKSDLGSEEHVLDRSSRDDTTSRRRATSSTACAAKNASRQK